MSIGSRCRYTFTSPVGRIMAPLPTSTPISRRLPDNSHTRSSIPTDAGSDITVVAPASASVRGRDNAHRHKPRRFGSSDPATLADHTLAHQCSLDPCPLVHADLPFPAIPRKAHAQLLRLLQDGPDTLAPVRSTLQPSARHRALQLSGNSAALEIFARSDHGGKYGVAGVVTASSTAAPEGRGAQRRVIPQPAYPASRPITANRVP